MKPSALLLTLIAGSIATPMTEVTAAQPFVREVQTGYLLQCSFLSPRPYCWKDDSAVRISGWDVDQRGGYFAFSPNCIYPAGFGFHSDWFKLVDTNQAATVSLAHQIARQKQGTLILEFRFRMPKPTDGVRWQLRDLDQAAVSLAVLDGSLCWELAAQKPIPLATIVADHDYGVKMVVNLDTKTAEVWVEGEAKSKALPFLHPVATIDSFRVQTGEAATGELFLNPVNLHRGYAVNETFVTSGVGKAPSDWESGGGRVEVFECGTKPDVLSLRLRGMAQKRFGALAQKTVFECRFLSVSEPAGIRIALRGAGMDALTLPIPERCRTNFWYWAKLVADPASQTADLYLNGKLTRRALPFEATVKAFEAVAFSGDLWIDDVQVYPWRDYPSDYVPEPRPVTSSHLLGVQSCNLWREGTAYAGWDYVLPFRQQREPVLGWYDEGNPEVTDWEIKWQVEHGITFEQHCWYRPNNAVNHPIKDGVLDQGILRGLFNARYSHLKKFTIMCTDEGACETNPTDWRENIIPYWIEYFFRDPRYLTIEGRPVVSIYDFKNWVRMFGGEAGGRAAIQVLRDEVSAAGFPGVIVMMEERNGDVTAWRTIKNLGADYAYSYTWLTPDAEIQKQKMLTARERSAGARLGVIPSVSMGWDRAAWGVHDGGFMPAADYLSLARWTKESYAPSLPADSLGRRMVLLANWNEFGEGHFMIPTPAIGFGYLDALRAVFTGAGDHTDVVPNDSQRRRLNLLFPRE